MVGLSVGTKITGEGVVVFRDETVYGLQRMCIEQVGRYPDLEMWSEMLVRSLGGAPRIWRHRYVEKVSGESGLCRCFLWMYWKAV